MKITLSYFLILVLVIGCSRHNPDLRLVEIEGLSDTDPSLALTRLDSIDRESLDEYNRHYYDFLKIKESDKAYTVHTSDSLYLSVLNYFNRRKSDPLYPEVLYYGGRVYSDLGDYPTALDYFQNALDFLADNPDNPNLKATILSQTGRLLAQLSLYDEAIPYIEKTIETDRQLNDTINLVYDMQLLAGIKLKSSKYDEAEQILIQSQQVDSLCPNKVKAITKMYLAEIKRKKGKIDSALYYIKNISDEVSPVSLNNALSYFSLIFLDAGMLDSASHYAKQLILLKDSYNKKIGYQVLLTPELRQKIPADTLNKYITEFRDILITAYDNNKIELISNQQNYYNYNLKEKKRYEIEKLNLRLRIWLSIILIVVLFLIVVIFYFRMRNKQHLVDLHVALENIEELKNNLTGKNKLPIITDFTDEKEPTEEELREKLKERLLELSENKEKQQLNTLILRSNSYEKLQAHIKKGDILNENDPIWEELEDVILNVSPGFKENLSLLTRSHVTSIDLHTAILVKCHIPPLKMATLLGRSKGAIVSRRLELSKKIFGKNMGTKIIDKIIRSI